MLEGPKYLYSYILILVIPWDFESPMANHWYATNEKESWLEAWTAHIENLQTQACYRLSETSGIRRPGGMDRSHRESANASVLSPIENIGNKTTSQWQRCKSDTCDLDLGLTERMATVIHKQVMQNEVFLWQQNGPRFFQVSSFQPTRKSPRHMLQKIRLWITG